MRITGGEWASRRVAGPPRGAPVRPTPDALREQAFAVLAPWLGGAAFLDLFAGTGVNSLEALSRGVRRVVLCEQAPAAQRLVRANLANLGASGDQWELLAMPVERALPILAGRGTCVDLVWCDPPFGEWRLGPDALASARRLGVLAPTCRVVLEVPPKQAVDVPGFAVCRSLRGAVLLAVVP